MDSRTAAHVLSRIASYLELNGESRYISPGRLGLPLVNQAVEAALTAHSGEAVPLKVLLDRPRLESYSARLARGYSRPAVEAEVRLRGLRPVISKSRSGFVVHARPLVAKLGRELRAGGRGPVEIAYALRRPHVTRANFGPVIVMATLQAGSG